MSFQNYIQTEMEQLHWYIILFADPYNKPELPILKGWIRILRHWQQLKYFFY